MNTERSDGSTKKRPLTKEEIRDKLLIKYSKIRTPINVITTLLMLLTYIGGLNLAVFFKGSIGEVGVLLGFIAWPAAVTYMSTSSPKLGVKRTWLSIRIICYVFMAILDGVVIAEKVAVIQHCNDTTALTDPCEIEFCNTKYNAVIGVLVFASVEALVVLILAILEGASMCGLATKYLTKKKVKGV